MTTINNFASPTLIALNGVELEVFEAGQENKGNPIVLCHGWPEHAYSWRHQMPALAAAGYHVIACGARRAVITLWGASNLPPNSDASPCAAPNLALVMAMPPSNAANDKF